jgi:ribosomal protein S18 acetylase RimI-like enzyme
MKRFDSIPPEYACALEEGLNAHNRQATITREEFLLAELANDRLVGGIRASVSLEALFIKHLWVDPAQRGRGLGRSLVIAAEAEGLRRGARVACVDTLSTQAPDFYRRLGYAEFGRLAALGPDRSVFRVWFSKTLP